MKRKVYRLTDENNELKGYRLMVVDNGVTLPYDVCKEVGEAMGLHEQAVENTSECNKSVKSNMSRDTLLGSFKALMSM